MKRQSDTDHPATDPAFPTLDVLVSLAPRDDPLMTTSDLLASACPKIGTLGSAFYFDPATLAVGKEHGLDGFRFYVLGRGGVLGDVEAPVIESAFGWWNPGLIASMWTSSRAKLAPREAGRIYVKCCQDLGRAKLASVSGLEEFCAAAEAVVKAANPAALSLFAGLAAEPLAEDAPGRAMQLTATLRELRGSAHIVAVLVAGLQPHIAHFIKRPDMYKAFGWGEEAPAVTDADRSALAEAEMLTDRLVTPAFSVLDSAGEAALLAGITGIEAAMAK